MGLALLRDQQSGEGSHHKLADKFAREMPTRPGKVLAAKLKEQNLSPLDMQKALGMDDNEFYKLDCGLIPVTQEMAEKLGEIISGTNAEFWMAAEAKYRMEREALIEDIVKSCLDA